LKSGERMISLRADRVSTQEMAVALNCGNGSSFLQALVNAFDKLHMVLAENSGVLRHRNTACGLQVASFRMCSIGKRSSHMRIG
jgi:hypothetical protein